MKLYIGIDWSQSKHDICFVNAKGAIQTKIVIPHSQSGFWQFEHRRRQLGISADACMVGLKTAHSIFVDFLWDQEYTNIFVLPPTLVNGAVPALDLALDRMVWRTMNMFDTSLFQELSQLVRVLSRVYPLKTSSIIFPLNMSNGV